MRKNLIAMSAAILAGSLSIVGGAAANVIRDNGAAAPAGTTTSATAQSVLPGGIGHQLIIPYYNVQAGNATLVNLINSDIINGKAVKVRFRGASNSDDVFDFQVFMSPGDIWSANISRGADGRAVLTSTDKSCTIPQTVSGTSFVTARLNPRLTGDTLAAETREGYIEIFNMADIPPLGITPATGAPLVTANALFTTTKHVGGIAPCFGTTAGAAALNALQNDPADLAAAYTLGLRGPSTGLFANWTIINVPKSGASSGEAIALTATVGAGGPNGIGNIVFFPQTGAVAATPSLFTADPALRTTAGLTVNDVQNGSGGAFGGAVPIIAASNFDLPDLSTPYLLLAAYPPVAADPVAQAYSLTRAIATVNVINEYLTETAIGAFTDWVFSSPTRRYSVALDYRPAAPLPFVRAYTNMGQLSVLQAPVPLVPTAGGRDYFTNANTSLSASGFQICTTTSGVTFYDREETTLVGNNFVISPNPPAAGFRLCGETSVLTFNAPGGQSVLGAEIARTDFATTPFRDGWANIGTAGVGTGVAGIAANGLPILGKAYTRAGNGTVSANFGGAWEHRYIRPATP